MNEKDVFSALKYRTYDAICEVYEWHNDAGQLHRDGGPALEFDDGVKAWFQNGLRHRTDGPALELDGVFSYWYQHDRLHREDGPAVELLDKYKAWYVNGEHVSGDKIMDLMFEKGANTPF